MYIIVVIYLNRYYNFLVYCDRKYKEIEDIQQKYDIELITPFNIYIEPKILTVYGYTLCKKCMNPLL